MPISSTSKTIALILRIAFGAMFIWASWDKILNPSGFAEIIDNYRLLPLWVTGIVAVVLPWIELLCGVGLIAGVFVNGSLVTVNFLLIVFTTALAVNAVRGVDVACGCFSMAAQAKGRIYLDIARDLVLLAVGFWLLYHQYQLRLRVPDNN